MKYGVYLLGCMINSAAHCKQKYHTVSQYLDFLEIVIIEMLIKIMQKKEQER